MVCLNGISFDTALRFFTENPARVMGLAGIKGTLHPGADADLLALDNGYAVTHLMARGKPFVSFGKAVCKGAFER